MEMKFSDGMNIDIAGPYRIIRKSDGLYVVGQGTLCAVDSRDEGINMIRHLVSIETKGSSGR